MVTFWISGLHYQIQGLKLVPGTDLQNFQLKSHQHEPQEFIQLIPPHSKAHTWHNSSFHRIRPKLFFDIHDWREATTTGASDSLPCRPLLEIQLHRQNSGAKLLCCMSFKNTAQLRPNRERFEEEVQGKQEELNSSTASYVASASAVYMQSRIFCHRLALPSGKMRKNY